METIRNYLETMFASMPNTPEVKKAKDELLAMMEDKYNELIADGANENAAVGTVISEFGNLDELAEDLGLQKEIEEIHEMQQDVSRRVVSMEEVRAYFKAVRSGAWQVALGVMLCIICVTGPIIAASLKANPGLGVIAMFSCIALAVGLFVFYGIAKKDWNFLKKEPCQIDITTANMVKEMRRNYRTTRAWMLAIGVVLCAFCWVPTAAFVFLGSLVPATLFFMIGVGVFLIVYSSMVDKGFQKILNLNDKKTISGSYGKDDEIEYSSKTATAVMSVYWPTVTCIYLCISFLTFRWDITWIIWPVAGIVRKILNITLAKED